MSLITGMYCTPSYRKFTVVPSLSDCHFTAFTSEVLGHFTVAELAARAQFDRVALRFQMLTLDFDVLLLRIPL
jgi:hypothetical protein